MMVLIVSFLALVTLGVSATATDFDQHHPACFLDRIEHCKHVDGLAAIFQCLEKHQSQNSPSCKASLEKSPAFKCSFDSVLLCPDANTHYELMACLWTRGRDQLSSRCLDSEFRGMKFSKCHQDKMTFCQGLSGLPRVMSCLADHESELSSGCQSVLGACPAFKCAHDAENFCPDVNDHHDFIKCIWDHRSEVSPKCKEAIFGPPLASLSHHHDHHQKHHGQDHRGHHHKHHDWRYHGHHHNRHHKNGHHQNLNAYYSDLDDDQSTQKLHKEHHHRRHHHHRDAEDHFKACKFDVRRFCYLIDSFVDKMACLASHEDDLSDSCRMVINRCPAFHCAHDVQKFCPGVKNKHEFIGCLWEHRHELSDECMNQNTSHNDGHSHISNDKCRHEREKMCLEDQRRLPKYDLECLGDQNQDDLSRDCRNSLHVRLKCKTEIDKFCSDELNYPFACLKKYRSNFGEPCKGALEEITSTKLAAESITSTPQLFIERNIITMMAFGAMVLVVSIVITWGVLTFRKRKAHLATSQYQRI